MIGITQVAEQNRIYLLLISPIIGMIQLDEPRSSSSGKLSITTAASVSYPFMRTLTTAVLAVLQASVTSVKTRAVLILESLIASRTVIATKCCKRTLGKHSACVTRAST